MSEKNEITEKLRAFQTQAIKKGYHIRLKKEGLAYNQAREISNAYFNHKPIAIGFPRNATQVIECLKFCADNNLKVRLRSGGHQHEGMCSADGIFMIRLSDVNFIEYEDDNTYITPEDADNKEKAWIGVGCKLKVVYDKLEVFDRMIPGGGCWNVNVGGLTQGGGWGLNARQHGLTCDNILAAEIVLANQEKVIATADNEYKDLFRAIRGGGGGNFGVVTRFLFKLHPISANLTSFSIYWKDNKMKEMIADWLQLQTQLKDDITTFLRIQVDQSKTHPLRTGGLFYGTIKELKTLLHPFLEKYKDSREHQTEETQKDDYKAIRSSVKKRGMNFSQPISLADAFNYDTFDTPIENSGSSHSRSISSDQYDNCKVTPPDSTCDAPHPHKVSSAFSSKTGIKYYQEVAQKVAEYYKQTDHKVIDHKFVRSYMTFHTLGGQIKKEPEGGTSFAFRDREFLMQFQSWWNLPPKSKKTEQCFKCSTWQDGYINWVKNFRKTMCEGNTAEGAFINFVDKDIPAKDKKALLKVYYGDKLKHLIDTKNTYDPGEIFLFEMSIPKE